MSKNHLERGLFHQELLNLLLESCEEQKKEVVDQSQFEGMKSLIEKLKTPQDEFDLDQIIHEYQTLLEPSTDLLEANLATAFSFKEFAKLKLSCDYPKMYRGLPRLYDRDFPSESKIKKEFTSLNALKKQMLLKALCHLYMPTRSKGKVTLFSWVMDDGRGDYVAAIEVFRCLKSALSHLELSLVLLVPKGFVFQALLPETTQTVQYTKNHDLKKIPKKIIEHLADADLVLQLPTYYPETKQLIKAVQEARSFPQKVEIAHIGEYGFIQSGAFHPKTGNLSLGLHFLEKGILTRKACLGDWDDVENERIKAWRNPKNHFYLVYLATSSGGACYLHSLLVSLEKDHRDLDLCSPDPGWFFSFYEEQKKQKRPLLEGELNVAKIELYYEDKIYPFKISKTGKTVRILCPGVIHQRDFRALLALSGNWVAVRGNQSLSEAISQGKSFFYDLKSHSRHLMKDLLAIAENRIKDYSKTLECLRLMASFNLEKSSVEGSWVEESYFQESLPWQKVAFSIGKALQDKEAHLGFYMLNQILVREFSANAFLCHFVQRTLFLRAHPDLATKEQELLDLFLLGKISFSELIERTKRTISSIFNKVF